MTKKNWKKGIAVTLLTSILSQQVLAIGINLPDVGKMVSEAASGISEAAGQAGAVISDTAQSAGGAISDATGAAGEAIAEAAGNVGKTASDIVGNVGKAASGAASQVSEITSGFASKAGDVMSDWGKQAGKAADDIKESLSDAGVKIKGNAGELGDATIKKASELTKAAGKTTEDAITAVSGAADYVVDQAGHVVDLAAVGAEYATSAATEAFRMLQEEGDAIMQIAEEALGNVDLTEDNWVEAREAVEAALEKAYEYEVLKGKKIDQETAEIITNIVFGSIMYSYQYSHGQITLGEYVSKMSEVLIREGLPSGVGFIITLLPIKMVPHADDIAKDATYYLISLAYGDKSGDKIEEEEQQLLEQEMETESVSE